VKLFLLIVFLVFLAAVRAPSASQLLCCLILLVGIAVAARLSAIRLLRTALLAAPFVGFFSLIVYLSGDAYRAGYILAKSYLSILGVLICISVTAVPELFGAALFFRSPVLLLEVAQLIYRYLFVLGAEARVMQTAFLARAGRPGTRALKASSGMVAVLFSRSYEKAVMIHRAMSARGFSGTLPRSEFRQLRALDFGVALSGIAVLAGLFLL